MDGDNLKKLLSLLLVLILSSFILCSCSKKPDNDTSQESSETSNDGEDGTYDDSLPWGPLH